MTRRVVARELRNLHALWLFLRRGSDVPEDGAAIHYSAQMRPIFWVFLVLNPLELVLVEFLVTNTVARLVLLVAGVLGTVWYVSLLASLYKCPHSIDPRVLRLRYLTSFDRAIPLGAIESVKPVLRSYEQAKTAAIVDGGLVLQIDKSTNVSITLTEPLAVDLGRHGKHSVVQIDFWADDQYGAVRLVHERLAVH
ncbi:MAG: hypothetical protein JWQ81_4631 [Amycolatopsis sp.]|jgi:hypothetical protein|uniref:hypothetical protein n=1 Tax=Amycolatopsis sp. TaxID=37632 RepID=UPI00262A1181|nr:hypothetical protein [Amycolatopsis sp.]MCU1683892.1 hypothetical protein [Amycolatopsis sp.]